MFRFPNLAVTKLLLQYASQWIDVDAVNNDLGETALHIIIHSIDEGEVDDNTTIIKLLLAAGADVECLNCYGKTAIDYAYSSDIRSLFPSNKTPRKLKYLCARLITQEALSYNHIWPSTTTLNKYLLSHGGLIINDSVSQNSSNLSWEWTDDQSIDYDIEEID